MVAIWPGSLSRSRSLHFSFGEEPPPKTAQAVAPQPSATPPPSPSIATARLTDRECRAHLGRNREGVRDQRTDALLCVRLGSPAAGGHAGVDQVTACFSTGPLKGRTLKLVGHADPRGQRLQYDLGPIQSRLGRRDVLGHADDRSKTESTCRGAIDATGTDEPRGRRDRRVDLMLDSDPRADDVRFWPRAGAARRRPRSGAPRLALFTHAAWPIKLTIGLLVGCSLLVWIISALKLMQLARLYNARRALRSARRGMPGQSRTTL